MKENLKAKIHECADINLKDIPFSEEVVNICKSNGCGKYGANWCCPPAIPSMEENIRMMENYRGGFVFSTVTDLEDSYDFEGMAEAKNKHLQLTRDILEEYKQQYPGARTFSAGACDICSKCAYPGSPCRFPDRAIPSFEGMGVNVMALSKKYGMHYINGVNTVTYFSLIIY